MGGADRTKGPFRCAALARLGGTADAEAERAGRLGADFEFAEEELSEELDEFAEELFCDPG